MNSLLSSSTSVASMNALIGQDTLAGAMLAAAAAVFASAAAARFNSDRWLKLARVLVGFHLAFVTIASITLIVALFQNNFHNLYVASYSERALPAFYKLAAFWAGQEGSLLLWAWMLAGLSALAIFVQSRSSATLSAKSVTDPAITTLALALICGFFAALLVFAADPFATGPAPPDGRGLNPLLQAPAMVSHPPILFLGYAGFTIPFATMLGALAAGQWNGRWVTENRRWLAFSWLMLSIGILLGAQWAYVELGWGGYWAWDPVENASLLPWLTSTALLHSIALQQQRGMMKTWNAGLVAASFFLCIFGTYLTRSGVIQSVHAFGESLIGTFFLAFLALGLAATLALILYRRKLLKSDQKLEGLMTKEGAFLATNVLLTIITLVTLIGTIFPILSSAFVDEPISVGPPFYNQVVVPMSLALLALMATGPLLRYGTTAQQTMFRSVRWPAGAAVGAIVIALLLGFGGAWAMGCAAVAGFALTAVAIDLIAKVRLRISHHSESSAKAFAHVIDNDHRRYGGQLIHVAMLMIMIGVAGSSLFGIEENLQFKPEETKTVSGYQIKLTGLKEVRGPNFNAVEAQLTLTEPSGKSKNIAPQMRFYDKTEQANSEVALESNLRRDVYLVLAGWDAGGQTVAIQVLINPLIAWIWIGGVLLTLGGAFCLVPRFLPRPATSLAIVAAGPNHSPHTAPA